MGRTPFTNPGQTPSPAAGRNHNQFGMVSWFAGGGVKGGADVGMTEAKRQERFYAHLQSPAVANMWLLPRCCRQRWVYINWLSIKPPGQEE